VIICQLHILNIKNVMINCLHALINQVEDVKLKLVRIHLKVNFAVVLNASGKVEFVLRNHVLKLERIIILIVMII